jgi:hypothetical protein
VQRDLAGVRPHGHAADRPPRWRSVGAQVNFVRRDLMAVGCGACDHRVPIQIKRRVRPSPLRQWPANERRGGARRLGNLSENGRLLHAGANDQTAGDRARIGARRKQASRPHRGGDWIDGLIERTEPWNGLRRSPIDRRQGPRRTLCKDRARRSQNVDRSMPSRQSARIAGAAMAPPAHGRGAHGPARMNIPQTWPAFARRGRTIG